MSTVAPAKMNKVEQVKKEKNGLDVWDDIFRYAEEGFEAITEDDQSWSFAVNILGKGQPFVRAELLGETGEMRAMTNALWLK